MYLLHNAAQRSAWNGYLNYATIRLSITSEHLRLIRAITLWGCKPCKGIAWITEISMGFYVKYSRTILYRMALLQESVLKGLRISGISSYFNPHTRSNALFMEPIENLLQNYDCHPLMLVIEICTSWAPRSWLIARLIVWLGLCACLSYRSFTKYRDTKCWANAVIHTLRKR